MLETSSLLKKNNVFILFIYVAFPVPDHGSQGHIPSATSFFEDTTTLVSMASSGVVLIAGVVAVVCLVMYKRRRNSGHHYRGKTIYIQHCMCILSVHISSITNP